MLNMLTLRWLEKIHPDLLSIVRTEYSKELRDSFPISGLVPRISLSIDALLAKYDKLPTVKAVQEAHGQSDVDVNRITFGARSGKNFSRNNQSKKDGAKGDGSNSSRQFCPGCYYLGNSMSARINYNHHPQSCPRSAALVSMLEAEESMEDPGMMKKVKCDDNTSTKVKKEAPMISRIESGVGTSLPKEKKDFMDDNVLLNKSRICATISRLVSMVKRTMSPAVVAFANGVKIRASIDEGSELNVVDLDIAKKCGFEITDTITGAKSAGSFSMTIEGQTKDDVILFIAVAQGKAAINLGSCLVVKNLGSQVLVGQPAKESHNIVTWPKSGKMTFRGCERKKFYLQHCSK